MTPSIAKNTAYLTIASVGQKVLAFVYFLLVARMMGAENTGAYFLALSITTIFVVVADFGVNGVLIREIAKRPEQAVPILRRALGAKVPFAALAVAAAIVTPRLLGYDPVVAELVLIAVFVMLADTVSLSFYGVLRGLHRLQFESLGIFIGQTITLAVGGSVLLISPSLHGLVVALLAGSLFNAAFSASRVARAFGAKALVPAWAGREALDLLRVALPFALAGLFVKGYSYFDSLTLGRVLGEAAVGVYSVAYKFTYAFQFLPLAFVAALYPGLSSVLKAGDAKRLRATFEGAMRYMLLLVMPIALGISAIAPDMVLLAGGEYAGAGPVLAALVLVLVPIFLDFPIGSLLNAADRQSTKTALMGVTLAINVVLNLALIPPLGIIGAAYAALVSFTFLFLGGFYFVPRIIKGYRYWHLARQAAPIVLSGLFMYLAALLLRPILGFVLVIPVAAVVYGFFLIATRAVSIEDWASLMKRFRKNGYAPSPSHDD